jgi:hypothetical protein
MRMAEPLGHGACIVFVAAELCALAVARLPEAGGITLIMEALALKPHEPCVEMLFCCVAKLTQAVH